MAIHGNLCRFVPLYSPKVQKTRVHRHTQNIIPEKSGRQVVDGGRNAAPPLQLRTQPLRPHRRGGCCVHVGDGSGGSSCARMRAGAATGRTAPTAEAEPAADRLRSFAESSAHRQPPAARQSHPVPDTEMRERSGSHGRRRYALRQGQKRRPAGLADFRGSRYAQPSPRLPPRERLRATR